MVFSSNIFILLFLPAVFLLNLIATKRFSNVVLLIASLIFYAWGEPYLVALMIASIIINWIAGIVIDKSSGTWKKVALIVGVVCNLGILGYYKYSDFLIYLMNRAVGYEMFASPNVILPIGISFFTFQAISYIADVYKGETKAASKLINVALYISFFPQLIAGPIVKYRDINEQIESRTISWQSVSSGFKRFIYGLAKKVLIANILGIYVDTIYQYDASSISFRTAWLVSFAYTFQIYYDFSGYSDMAIGLGKMFGFTIPENFNYPYLSGSISEFWRRWHISLGSWFKEYVYIPLGGNRKGEKRTYLNLFIVFFLTGLWHGAGMAFILWGIYHGMFQIAERLGLKKILDKSRVISVIYCFLVVNFGWVLFRAGNLTTAAGFLKAMLNPCREVNSIAASVGIMDSRTVFTFICAILGAGAIKSIIPGNIADKWRDSIPEALFCVAIFALSVASLANNVYNPFIYFQF